MRKIFWLGFIFILGACGQGPIKGRIAESISGANRRMLKKDFRRLNDLKINDNSELEILGVPDYSPETLANWLNERIQHYLGESPTVTKSTYTYKPIVGFTMLPLDIQSDIFDASSVKTLAYNAGGSAYLNGKKNNELRTLSFDDIEVVADSPRVGVVVLEQPFFELGDRFESSSSMAGTLVRLGTVFHEARHSDGNGASLGMAHAECVKGDFNGKDAFIGEYACEKYLNGPYEVGRVLIKKWAEACGESCTDSDQQTLALSVGDLLSRRINKVATGDARPERTQ